MPRVCSILECEGEYQAKGYCKRHYENYRIHGDPLYVEKRYPNICIVENCDNKRKAKGYCTKHYRAFKIYGNPLITKKRKKGTCKIKDCEDLHVGLGYCGKHLNRYRKYGDPLKTEKRNYKGLTIKERFMKYIKKENDCWLWTGYLNNKGYGKFLIYEDKETGISKQRLAHRVSYELFNGELIQEMYVCHSCDNPSCVNPDHLFLGTHQHNVDDMTSKKRQAVGENVAKSVLTWEQVDEIRELYKTGNYLYKDLGEMFNYAPQNISLIIRNKIWKEEYRLKGASSNE